MRLDSSPCQSVFVLLALSVAFTSTPAAAAAPGVPTLADIVVTKQTKKKSQPVPLSKISRDGIRKPMRGFAGVEETGFRVAYAPTDDPTFKPIRERYEASKTLENIADEINEGLVLPGVIDIHMVSCGTANAFYDPSGARIILCYELVAYFLGMFRDAGLEGAKLDEATHGALLFAFYHELGHGLVDVLELPVTGREEDAVDQLATVVLLNEGSAGVRMALAGAQWLLLQGNAAAGSELTFWDEHSLDQQRYFDISCLIYGHAPDDFEELIGAKGLPRRRARRCPKEYARVQGAWAKLLQPHMRASEDGDLPPNVEESAESAQVAKPSDTPKPTDTSKPEAKPAGTTCEVAIGHVMTKIFPLFLKSMSPVELRGFEPMDEALKQMTADGIQECRTAPWTEAQRRCVLSTVAVSWAETCF